MHGAAAPCRPSLAVLACALAACALAGCAATQPAVREYQDERTAATVTVAGNGFVFGETLSAYAVNARNFLSLVPVEINQGGSHVLYWYGYTWSTIDKRFNHEPPSEYVLEVDGRQIELALRDTSLAELGLSAPPFKAPSDDARAVVAVTSRADLRRVAEAKQLAAFGRRDGSLERYDVWEDGRTAIEAYLDGAHLGR